jgi:hypothetical protein
MLWRSFRTRLACGALVLAGCTANISFPPPVLGPCDRNHGGCDMNALCSVAVDAGTATCVCKTGFEGDGTTCVPFVDGGSEDGGDGNGDAGNEDAGPADGGSPDAGVPDASVDGG